MGREVIYGDSAGSYSVHGRYFLFPHALNSLGCRLEQQNPVEKVKVIDPLEKEELRSSANNSLDEETVKRIVIVTRLDLHVMRSLMKNVHEFI